MMMNTLEGDQNQRCSSYVSIERCHDSNALTTNEVPLLESSSIFCRICHEGEESEELIRPCKCCGSVEFVHHSCLLNWISRCGDLDCELCKHRYRIRRMQKRRILEWKLPPVGVKGWLHIVLFFAFLSMFLTSVTWIIWSQTSKSSSAMVERSSPEIKYAYTLDGIFILTALVGILVDSVRQFRRYIQRILALNKEYIIMEYCPTVRPAKCLNDLSVNDLSFSSTNNTRLVDQNIQNHSLGNLTVHSAIGTETSL